MFKLYLLGGWLALNGGCAIMLLNRPRRRSFRQRLFRWVTKSPPTNAQRSARALMTASHHQK
jgi:hypothetical protein